MVRRKQSAVFCRTSFEGIHCWPEAPLETYYLRNPHRHIFHVEVEVDVKENDREIEFINLKHNVDRYLKQTVVSGELNDMGRTSCEEVANKLADWLRNVYPQRDCYVEVTEDGENGARLYVWHENIEEEDDYDGEF